MYTYVFIKIRQRLGEKFSPTQNVEKCVSFIALTIKSKYNNRYQIVNTLKKLAKI